MARTYGWTHNELLSMKVRLFFTYLNNAIKLNAVDHLMLHKAAILPNIGDKNEIKKVFDQFDNIIRNEIRPRQDSIKKLKRGIKGFKHGHIGR